MSSILASGWEIVKRHKGKVVLVGGAIGGFWVLNKYLTAWEKSWEKSSSRDFVSEVRKKETHFENTIQTCNSTCTSLAPKIMDVLDSVLDAEPILETMKMSGDNKLNQFEELKIRIFTRLISEVYCVCLFVAYLRVQLSVIAGYIYVDSVNSSNGIVNQSIQMKYLSLLNSFYQDGIQKIVEPVERVVASVIGPLSLKKNIVLQDMKDILEKIKVEMCSSDFNSSKYLIAPERLGNGSNSTTNHNERINMTYKDTKLVQKMLAETQDILDSDDFRKVLDSSVDIGFSLLMDLVLGCFVKFETKSDESETGFANPHSIEIPLAKLLPLIRQALLARKKPDEQIVLVRHLLCLDVLNCFAANIYEAFCQPNSFTSQ